MDALSCSYNTEVIKKSPAMHAPTTYAFADTISLVIASD